MDRKGIENAMKTLDEIDGIYGNGRYPEESIYRYRLRVSGKCRTVLITPVRI